jgi:hypothetical protein
MYSAVGEANLIQRFLLVNVPLPFHVLLMIAIYGNALLTYKLLSKFSITVKQKIAYQSLLAWGVYSVTFIDFMNDLLVFYLAYGLPFTPPFPWFVS